jgi:hypothetical protein
MSEKGQGLLFLMSLIVLIILLLVSGVIGFLLGRNLEAPQPSGKISIVDSDEIEFSEPFTSTSTIDNCAGASDITFDDEGKFSTIIFIDHEDAFSLSAGLRDTVLFEIGKTYNIQNNHIREDTKMAKITVLPNQKVEITYTWRYQYKKGIAWIGEKEYEYAALTNIEINYRSNPVNCK